MCYAKIFSCMVFLCSPNEKCGVTGNPTKKKVTMSYQVSKFGGEKHDCMYYVDVGTIPSIVQYRLSPTRAEGNSSSNVLVR